MKTFAYLLTLVVGHVGCEFWLQILHTNDIHSRFDETDEHSGSCSAELSEQNKCFGGFARLKTAIGDAKEEAKRRGIATMCVNGGDNFVGTPFYNLFKWKIVAELVDKLEFDVMTLGNHEFDDGVSDLASYLKAIKTPVVCSNLNFTSERRLEVPILTRSKILTVDGMRIGIVGYLTPDTMQTSRTEGLQILPEIEHVRAEARSLKAAGVEIIVALGHSEFHVDLQIAAEVEELSVIVGAHSHTFLYTPPDQPPSTESAVSDYPTIVRQKSGKTVPVVQAYAYSKYLGKILLKFNDKGTVIDTEGAPIILNSRFEKDRELDKLVSEWKKAVDEQYGVIQGYSRVPLLKSNFIRGEFESTIGNLLTDAVVDQVVETAKEKGLATWTHASIVIWLHGAIRTSISYEKCIRGITLGELLTTLPFDDKLVEVAVYGSTIRKMLEFSVAAYDAEKGSYHLRYFMHFSGLRVIFDFSNPPEKRVKSIEALCAECRVPIFQPLEEKKVYNIVTLSYLMHYGNKGYMIRDEYINMTYIGKKDMQVLIRYLKKNRIVYPKLDGRITVVGFKNSSHF